MNAFALPQKTRDICIKKHCTLTWHPLPASYALQELDSAMLNRHTLPLIAALAAASLGGANAGMISARQFKLCGTHFNNKNHGSIYP